jgi:hypothetical protein
MENGDHLVRCCASNDVPLILHGLKRKPRFVGQEIEFEGRTRLVRAVGCGSNFGDWGQATIIQLDNLATNYKGMNRLILRRSGRWQRVSGKAARNRSSTKSPLIQ